MKPFFLLLSISLLLSACQTKVSENDLNFLGGYWEIEKVVLSNNQKKEYEINTYIDFFEIKDKKGFRKKVQPQLNGTFLGDKDMQPFTLFLNEGVYHIEYQRDMQKWQEKILRLNEKTLVLQNHEGLEYWYKRYEPINITP